MGSGRHPDPFVDMIGDMLLGGEPGEAVAPVAPGSSVALSPLLSGGVVLDQGGLVYNAKALGVLGTKNGGGDTTALVNTAITTVLTAGGGDLLFPNDNYLFAGQVTIQNGGGNASIRLVGQSYGSALFNFTSTTLDLVLINATAGQIAQIELRNLNFNGSASASAGVLVHTKNCNIVIVEKCFFNQGWTQVFIDTGSNNVTLRDVNMAAMQNRGLQVAGASRPNAVNLFNLQIYGAGSGSATGMELNNVTSILGVNVNITGTFAFAAQWNVGGGQNVDWGFWWACDFDGATNGIYVHGSNQIRGQHFTDCFFGSNTNTGMIWQMAASGLSDDNSFTSCRFQNNGQDGATLDGANGINRNMRFTDCTFGNNGTSNANTFAGLLVKNGFSGFQVTGGKAGFANINGAACVQQYGISITGATSNEFQIRGVDVQGNVTLGINDASTSTTRCVIKDCIGYNPQGVAAIAPGASPYTYTAGHTPEVVYIVGGTVSLIVKNAITLGTGTSATVPIAVPLEPNEAVVVTYSVVPTMNKDRK